MPEESIFYAGLHDDHQDWQGRNSRSQEQLSVWQEQLESATVSTQEFLEMLKQHSRVLAGYKTGIDSQARSLKSHKSDVAASELKEPKVSEQLTSRHSEMDRQAKSLGTQHESIEKQHHALVKKLEELQRILVAPGK